MATSEQASQCGEQGVGSRPDREEGDQSMSLLVENTAARTPIMMRGKPRGACAEQGTVRARFRALKNL